MPSSWDTQASSKKDAGARLTEAMRAKGYIELKPYARHLAGDGADEKRVESIRRQLRDWRDGTVRMSDGTAEWLARDLDQPAAAFKSPRPQRRSRADEIARLEKRVEDLAEQLEAVQEELRRRPPEQEQRPAG